MIATLQSPWHWSIAGLLIGLTVPLLYLLGNKPFGISSSFRHLCAACIPSGLSYFKYDWKRETWNLFFVVGIATGGWLAVTFLGNVQPFAIDAGTQQALKEAGVRNFETLLPTDIFSWQGLLTFRGFILIVVGGFLVGFGTRYAGGCTSGHSITGIANLQVSSIISTICFMAGGFIVTWLVLPYILTL